MQNFIWFLVSLIVSHALAPKPPRRKPASLDDFELPTAEEGRPIPVVFGSPLVRGLNTLWYGNLDATEVIKGDNLLSSGYTAGIIYRLDMHLAICHGPVEEATFFVDDKNIAHSRRVNGTLTHNLVQPVTAGEHEVFLPDFFGGYRKEGGLLGFFEFMDGSESQINTYLVDNMNSLAPGYRGIASILLKNFYLSANSTYLKPWSAKVKRISAGWNGVVPNPTKVELPDKQMNPAHIIYQALTDPEWGMGQPIADMDDVVFFAAMDRLYDENFGLSFVWVQQSSVEDFIQEVANHIGAQVYINPYDGKWGIKLIRDDYDAGLLDVFDENNSEMVSFERSGYHERINELTVNYQTLDGEAATITMHNIAAIQSTGSIINHTVDYPGIRNAELAAKVCLRDLKIGSAPLSKLVIKTNRDAWAMKPGDVFKYSNSNLGLNGVVYRCIKVTKGTLENPEITITATEDYFSLPTNAYSLGQSGLWEDPNQDPDDISIFRIEETSYLDLVGQLGETAVAALSSGLFVQAMAVKPAQQNTFLSLQHSSVNNNTQFEEVTQTGYTPVNTLAANISKDDGVILLSSGAGLSSLSLGSVAYLNNEQLRIDAINTGNNSITVGRACGDTIPEEHSLGDRIWFYEGFGAIYNNETPPANNYFKLLGVNAIGETDTLDFTSVLLNPSSRHLLPYPPANLRINSNYWPALIASGDFSIAWNSRNKLEQGGDIVDWYSTGYSPDPADSFTLVIRDPADNVLVNSAGINADGSGNASYTYTGTKYYRYSLELTCNGVQGDSQTVTHTFESGDPVTIDNPSAETSVNQDQWQNNDRPGTDGWPVNYSFRPSVSFTPLSGAECWLGSFVFNRSLVEQYFDVDLTAYRTTTELDAGNEQIYLEWYQNFENGNAQIGFDVMWLDSGDSEISTSVTPRTTTANDTWTKREEVAAVPSGARTARIYMVFERISGDPATTYLDGGIDDIAARIF